MIELPAFDKAFDFENGFHLTSDVTRVAKILAHYDLYRQVVTLPGAIVECGVFKGASFACLAAFRALLEAPGTRKLIGFDTFSTFPATLYPDDLKKREAFIREAGDKSISTEQLRKVLQNKGIDRDVDLVEGNILETVPAYVQKYPGLRIALLNLDTDVYEPAKVILEHFWPRIVPGGLLLLDDYGVFAGENQAVEEYFHGQKIQIEKLPYRATPCFIRKQSD